MHNTKITPTRFTQLCILLISIAFALCLYASKKMHMDENPGTWAIYAIPHTLSKTVFKHDKKYTSNRAVRDTYTGTLNSDSNKNDVNFAINAVLKLDKKNLGKDLYLWENEDKGIIDFISMAFNVYGNRVQSILYFYFFIIGISCSMFVAAFIKLPSRLVILLHFLIMLYLIIPIAALHPQLQSLMAPRIFPILSIVASLHCVLFALQPRRDRLQLLLVAVQALIIVFVIHIRIVAYWQLLAICGAAFFGFLNFYFRKQNHENKLLSLVPVFFVVLGLVVLHSYKLVVFPKEYKAADQPMTRVMWHNIFSGLAFDPELANRYKLKVDDISVMDATAAYLAENGREEEWIALGGLAGGGRDSGYTNLRWIPYEQTVKEMLFARCREFPLQCLRSAFYYKPLSTVKTIAWAYGLRQFPPDMDIFVSSYKGIGDAVKMQCIATTHELDVNKLRAYLWSPVAVTFFILTLLVLLKYSYDITAIVGVVILTVFSFAPSIIGHPGAHNVLDTTIVVGFFIYTCIGLILSKIFSEYKRF